VLTDPVDRQVPNVRLEAGSRLDLTSQLLDRIEVQFDDLTAGPTDQVMVRRSLRRPFVSGFAAPRS